MDALIRKNCLAETARWQKVLGVFFAVCAVLIVVFAIGATLVGIVLGRDDESAYFLTACLLLVPVALLYYYPAKYLFTSAKRFNEWVAKGDDALFDEGLKNNKSFFKFTGILSIIVLAFMALFLILAIIAGVIVALA